MFKLTPQVQKVQKTPFQLKEQSEKAVAIFQQAISELEGINDTARLQIEEKEKQIANLEAEVVDLDRVQVKNAKVIGKIKAIFEE